MGAEYLNVYAGVQGIINKRTFSFFRLLILHGVVRAIGGSEFSDLAKAENSDNPGFFIHRNTNFQSFFNDLVR